MFGPQDVSNMAVMCICGEHEGNHHVPLLAMGVSKCGKVSSAVEDVSADGRRMWWVIMEDGTKEIVVELTALANKENEADLK